MTQPPRWTDEQLAAGLAKARHLFRDERLKEPLEAYTKAFDQYKGAVENLLDSTSNLEGLGANVIEVLADSGLREAFRYLAGPPISEDDLAVLAEGSLSTPQLRTDPAKAARVFRIIQAALDPRRFPWVMAGRGPTDSERNAAIVASATLLAVSRVGTNRRNEGKERQEISVLNALLGRKWNLVRPRSVANMHEAPDPGEFCRESLLGLEKADFLLGLRDRRIMAIECKVSNSYVNSVKRLNREAAGKAATWIKEFGERNVVPVAVLSGVFKLHNLKNAQDMGLTIYWAHDLNQLLDWIDQVASKDGVTQ